ncbi:MULTISPECIES: hypothetical protein [Bacillus subtilis group]|uniref:hypothetical protein n=1 Tax=Bacillus subtilis group TaxID=653685 RepID=UPI0010E4346C|nr:MULTISPECIES: hypothetical protein [Bacillus subtilis group]MCY8860350.1 hypothetical protein [Bacillus inaquosorum]MCY8875847.1 hypothetical protein [Bacillus inaquosorum]TDU15399.1 hypothetical protein DFO78_102326 [Bacillus subtilis]
MDELRNWILCIAGIVTTIKNIYDMRKQGDKNRERNEVLSAKAAKPDALNSELQGD